MGLNTSATTAEFLTSSNNTTTNLEFKYTRKTVSRIDKNTHLFVQVFKKITPLLAKSAITFHVDRDLANKPGGMSAGSMKFCSSLSGSSVIDNTTDQRGPE